MAITSPSPTRNPTLADVAKQAGLARTTVAEILRGKAGYNEQTRKRVRAAAKRMGYRPNQLGKALRRGKSMTIGIIASSINTAALLTKIEGAELAARAAGYTTYMAGWGEMGDGEAMARIAHDLMDRRVDGIIFSHNVDPPQTVIDALADATMPVVYLDWAPPGAVHRVWQHRENALRAMAQHLASLGHRRGALLTTAWGRANPHAKYDLITQLCNEAGIEVDRSARWHIAPIDVMDKAANVTGAYETVSRAIPDGDLPTVILASNDSTAMAAMAALQDAGLHVPGDISVVGYDDDPQAAVVRPALTTIHQPRTGVGAAAFAMLHDLMNQPDADVTCPEFNYELVIRDSTGPAPPR